jgi:signal transduction histidine kinase
MNDEQIIQRINLLRNTSIFKLASDKELRALAKSLTERVVQEGKTIIYKGDKGKNLFIVVDGRIKIHDEEHVYDIAGKGHVFGEYSLFHTETRTATVTALETTHLLVLSQDKFKIILGKNPAIRTAVGDSLVETIAVQNRMEKELVLKNKLIEEQKSELVKTINIKNRFFSLIAHDLRSPLSSLSTYLNLLIDSNLLSKQEISDFATDLKKSVNNVNDMLDNLLNWAVSKTDDWSIKPEVFDLNNSIIRVLELYHSVASQKNITLLNQSKSSMIFADKNSVDVVLRNLISNAIKYSNNGGEVVVSVKEDEKYVIVSVKDNGIGMDSKIMESLYSLERKNRPRGTDNEKGTGLGLILSKEFAEKNNGFLKFDSTLNKGTTFYFYLPKK